MDDVTKICLIGAGNVSTHLCKACKKRAVHITQVFSRDINKATILADSVGAIAVSDLYQIESGADIYIIAVKDDAIFEVAKKLHAHGKISTSLVVHTSGFSSLSPVSIFSNHGVFWPLQTFSKADKIKFKKIPICIHANSDKNTSLLQSFASQLSKNVTVVDDKQRAHLHVAAVFANNFSNHMFAMAKEICDDHSLDFNLLRPLIEQTIRKIRNHSPAEVQTGPGVRKDIQLIEKQLKLLSDKPAYQEVYRIITESISRSNLDED